jgi:hypothetical protein
MVGIMDDPDQSAKVKVAAFNALRMADKDQWEREHPQQRGTVNVNVDASTKTVNIFDDIKARIELIEMDSEAAGDVRPDGDLQPLDAAQPADAEAEPEAG